MSKQNINIGSTPNDGSGDTLRDAAVKINSNFTELYNTSGLDTSFTQAAFNTANGAFDKANTSTHTSNTLINGVNAVTLDDAGDLILATNGGIVFDRANTSIRVGMGFHIASGEGISLEAIDETDPMNMTSNNWYFDPTGNLTLPQGSIISETADTTVITPPGALTGQSLVIRPTSITGITSNHPSGFIDGDNIILTVTPNNGGAVTGTVDFTFTGCTEEQLGRTLTGTLSYDNESSKTITWTIPVSSSITTFTITLSNPSGFGLGGSTTLTLTRTGSTEDNHIHLVTGDPTTVDLYLGDDDQYVKIEKNGGDVVIGTNLNSNQWTFGTDGNLRLPEDGYIVGNLRLPEDGYIVDSHGISVIVHPYVLDIEIDGGTTNSVYSKNDIVFDGGSTSSVFTFGQAVIDGCSAFSHSISKNFDGGSAVTI